MKDKETVEDFLSRGGEIKKVPFGKKTYPETDRFAQVPATDLSFKNMRDIRKNRRKARGLSTK